LLNLHSAGVLLAAGIVGGALNSVAGGGGFICFPALLLSGVPPIPANATNAVALWPGTLASTGAYRREFGRGPAGVLGPLLLMSLLGGALGALLLLKTPEHAFTRMIPWLLLAATLLFTFAGKLTRRHPGARHSSWGMWLLQFLIAIYIGYFGAGAGILMLALLAVMGMTHIHTMNAFKTLLATCANGVAVLTFIVAGAVYWPQALLMTTGAVVGGYGGAHYAQKVDPRHVRYLVIAVGFFMTAYFFLKTY
jgi:uncharacterized membrane protein YfcA